MRVEMRVVRSLWLPVVLALAPLVGAACGGAPAPGPAAPPATSSPAATASSTPAWLATPAASSSAPAVASSAPLAPPRPRERVATAPAACVGARLSFETVVKPCACESTSMPELRRPGSPDCDFVPADEAAVKQALRAELILAAPTVAPGKSLGLVVRYSNTGTEPLHVRLERDAHAHVDVLDTAGKPVPDERDPACVEVGILSMASFALVVLPPGGMLEVPATWQASRGRRVPDHGSGMGCKTVPGSALKRGSYKVRVQGHHVWDLREQAIVADVTVQ